MADESIHMTPEIGEHRTILPTPVLAIKQALCFSCFKYPDSTTSLSRCAGCKRVSYCSPACQKENWKDHKKSCKILKELNSFKGEESRGGRTWIMFRQEKVSIRDSFGGHSF
jgi:splicing suppressor protein 51